MRWCVILLPGVQVLVGHTKAEVFDMVRDLDLPLEQGNVQLLKKLQALGLHANRYTHYGRCVLSTVTLGQWSRYTYVCMYIHTEVHAVHHIGNEDFTDCLVPTHNVSRKLHTWFSTGKLFPLHQYVSV